MKNSCCRLGLFFLFYQVFGQKYSAVLDIPEGKLQGIYLKSRDGRQYSAFMAIPYGKQPEKFELPEPAPNWEGIHDASKFGSVCPQINMAYQELDGDEDCLFVNVFTPDIKGDLSVMVFIHGGGFQFGNSDENGADYFMDEDIVLVTLNYRVAALGFLSTGDEELPGNLGLKDQNLALKWVQKNIKSFGGDPERVTLFGESAGGAAVSHHIISPLSAGLFRYAICQSGTALNPFAFIESPAEAAFEVANALNCSTDSTKEIKSCLKTKTIEEILSVMLMNSPLDSIVKFGPTVELPSENAFLTTTPEKAFSEGTFSKIPLLATVNEDEGLLIHSALIMKQEPLREMVNEHWLEMAPNLFSYDDEKYDKAKKDQISKNISKYYFNLKNVSQETFQNLTNLFSDSLFIHGTRNAALLHAKHAPVYVGVLGYRGIWSQIFNLGYTEVLGVAHADDLHYLFTADKYPKFEPKSEAEYASKLLVKTLVNFAKTGTPGFSWEGLTWKPVSPAEIETNTLNWMYLKKFPETMAEPLKTRMEFWDKVKNALSSRATQKDPLPKEEL